MDVLYPATVGPETNATATLGVKRDSANRTFTQEVHSVEKDVRKVGVILLYNNEIHLSG